MQRKLILIDVFWTRDKDPRIPLGHASLLASVLEAGIEVRTVVVAVNSDQSSLDSVVTAIWRAIGEWRTDQVDLAFGAYVWGEDLLKNTLKQMRTSGFTGRILLGGPQISYACSGLEVLYPEADAFVRGYGERALVEWCRGEAPKGVHIARTNDLNLQASIEFDELASPWLTGMIPLHGQKFIRWETQRGCPYRCSFCQHREAGGKLKNAQFAESRIYKEIEMFCEHEVQDIAVLDPIFNVRRDRAVEILKKFAEHGFRGKLSLQCRAELTTEEFLDTCADMNVCLEFGLQTTNERESIDIDRRNKLAKIDETLRMVRERGINHEVSLIFGLPGQTLESFRATVDWCLQREIPVIKAFPLMLLRGTKLEMEREKWGFRDSGGDMPVVVESNSYSHHEWTQMNAISEALKATEGDHPNRIEELTAADVSNKLRRWRPNKLTV